MRKKGNTEYMGEQMKENERKEGDIKEARDKWLTVEWKRTEEEHKLKNDKSNGKKGNTDYMGGQTNENGENEREVKETREKWVEIEEKRAEEEDKLKNGKNNA